MSQIDEIRNKYATSIELNKYTSPPVEEIIDIKTLLDAIAERDKAIETYEQSLNSLGEHINYLRELIKQLSPETYERLMRDVQKNTKL